MTIHDLKLWPKFFSPITRGDKTFELRFADRNYHVGDVLLLREYNPITQRYTGRQLRRHITYLITSGHAAALQPGYVCLGLGQPKAVA